MYQKFSGYSARFAGPGDEDAVYAFYNTNKRPEAVYLRNRDLVDEQVKTGLFFTIWHDDQIVAASTAYPLASGKKIGCILENGRVVERGSVVELGSVLKRIEHVNDNGEKPRNFFHGLLFGVPMIEAFRRAGEEVAYPRIDLLVANVQVGLTDTINRLMAGPPESPHRWRMIKAAPELLEAFGETTSDPNAKHLKEYYRASIRNLPDVAEFLLGAAQRGHIRNNDGDELHIDMSGLPLSTYNAIVENRGYFENAQRQLSWNETRRMFEPSMPFENAPMMRPADGFGQQHLNIQTRVGIVSHGTPTVSRVASLAEKVTSNVVTSNGNGSSGAAEKPLESRLPTRPESDFSFPIASLVPAATPGGQS